MTRLTVDTNVLPKRYSQEVHNINHAEKTRTYAVGHFEDSTGSFRFPFKKKVPSSLQNLPSRQDQEANKQAE